MNVRLLLLRHGQTDWNREYRYQGRTDVPLNRTGTEQARLAAAGLLDHGIDLVVASPLKRAAETGRIIADRLGLELRLDPDLVEISHGRWDGQTREAVREEYLKIIETWKEDLYGRSAPDGESIGQVRDRVIRAIDRIVSGNKGRTVLVVGHDGALRAVRLGLLGLGFERYLEIGLEPGRMVEIIAIDGRYLETVSDKLW